MSRLPLNKRDFNNFIKSDYDLFRQKCNFTADQLKILDGFQKDMTETEIIEAGNICKTTYDNLVRQVKLKIIRVLEAENLDILPKKS